MAKKTYVIGFLLLVITATLISISLPDNVKIDITKSSSTFSVWENNWVVSGVEYNYLYNGTKSISRGNTTISNITNGSIITIKRNAVYGKSVIIDTYVFDGNSSDVELFPISHTIEIINGTNLIYQYKADKLLYSNPTKLGITSPQSFGHKMKLTWSNGNYYSQLYNYPTNDLGKLTLKYKINSSYVKYDIRLFDPETYTCYQEQANISTIGDGSCGVNYNGEYTTPGNWSDGNWSTYTDISGESRYVTYSKPLNFLNATIETKSGSTIENFTLPSSCLIYSPNNLSFKFTDSELWGHGIRVYCYDGSWKLLGTIESVNSLFYEEAMIWGITTVIITQSPANNTSYNLLNNTFICNASTNDNLSTIGINVYEGFNGLCYQESANVSTSCGGLNTGTYSGTVFPEMYDGDWDTYKNFGGSCSYNYFYINYTKPNSALNTSLWRVKSNSDVNYSIPKNCWDYSANTLSLMYKSNDGGCNVGYSGCYNGTGWELLSSSTYRDLYEEAMIWNITQILINNATTSVSGTSNSSTFSFDIYSGNHTWFCWANSSTGVTTNGSSYNLINPENVNISYTNSSAKFIFRNNKINESIPDGQTNDVGFFNVTNYNVRNISIFSLVNYTIPQVYMKAGNSSNYTLSTILNTTNQTILNLQAGGNNYIWFWADYVNYSGSGIRYAPKLTLDYLSV